MPSVSTLRICAAANLGEGGGVCSIAAPRGSVVGLGRSIAGDPVLERGDDTGDRGSSPSCERFSFFAGGDCADSVVGVALGVGRCTREP